jgi:hypothetical protein
LIQEYKSNSACLGQGCPCLLPQVKQQVLLFEWYTSVLYHCGCSAAVPLDAHHPACHLCLCNPGAFMP